MRLVECPVTHNLRVRPGYHILGFRCGELGSIEPGQFITVSVDGVGTILRRPFSIYRVFKNNEIIEIFFKIVGKGTKALSELKEGTLVSILGPLGKGFPLYEGVTAVLLSRGVGLASLALLGDRLKKLKSKVITIASFKSRDVDLVSDNEYVNSFSNKVIALYDEDRSSDVENVRRLLNEIKPDVVYTCGSKRLVRLLKELPYEAYVAWEERMGCAVGACRSCVVKTITGYKLTCYDGPVFNVKELIP